MTAMLLLPRGAEASLCTGGQSRVPATHSEEVSGAMTELATGPVIAVICAATIAASLIPAAAAARSEPRAALEG